MRPELLAADGGAAPRQGVGSYEIVRDVGANRLDVRLAGFLGPNEIEGCAAGLAAAYRALPSGGHGHIVLIDTRECVPQSQDVVSRMRTVVEACPKAGRIAMLNMSGLVRLQLKRVLSGRDDRVRFFETKVEAESWLGDGQSASQQRRPMPTSQSTLDR